mgnify:CR=1 FL=1
MPLDAEVAMYEMIVKEHVPSGSVLIIKPHPFSMTPLAERLSHRINKEYCVNILPVELRKYPFELMYDLFKYCQIIAFSTTILSLTYLYDKQVINPMNEKIMKEFFPTQSWDLIIDSQNLYKNALDNIPGWDRKGMLWCGENR